MKDIQFDPLTLALVDQVRRYVAEKECPAPDYIMRNVEYGRLKAALGAWDVEHALNVERGHG